MRGVQVMVQVAQKVACMHEAGWMHRNLAPGNAVWVPSSSSWALLDFGCMVRTGVPESKLAARIRVDMSVPRGSMVTPRVWSMYTFNVCTHFKLPYSWPPGRFTS